MRRDLQKDDSVFPTELLPHLFDLLSDQFGAVRKFVAEILGEIGLKYVELIPEIVPLLIKSLEDETPAVARQVIACGADLFRSTLERVAVQVVFLFLFLGSVFVTCSSCISYVNPFLFDALIAIWLPGFAF
jgi:hypothetical protein